MSVNVQSYVDSLFNGYENTPALQDFKEEIQSNLLERIQDLQKKGLGQEEAFTKAIAELGDITAIADQISQQKRNEIIGRMYIDSKTKIGMKHAIGYVVAGAVALFGVLVALTTYFTTKQVFHGISALIPFLIPSVAGFVFLGLTQETSRNYPMKWGRALIYALASGVTLYGLLTSALIFFMGNFGLNAVFGPMIPFVIPGLAVLAFLLLTEKSRNKPWVVEEQKLYMEHYKEKYADPKKMHQRGLLSGALWLFAIAFFVVLGLTIGFLYSWVVFLFAIAFEVLIEFWVQKQK